MKKTKKKQKVAAPPKKAAKKIKVEVASEVEEDALEVVEEPKVSKKVQKKPQKKIEKGKKEQKTKKEKRNFKGVIFLLVILVLLAGGGIVAKKILTKTTVVTETVKLPDDVRGISNYFKEYLLDRVKIEKLFKYDLNELSSDKVLAQLTDLKEGFSKVSRGVSGNYRTGEYKELAEVMEADAATCLTAVRELKLVLTASYKSKEEQATALAEKAEETLKDLRSALYLSTAAFAGDVPGFSSKGVIVFGGPALVEVGGGVMNVLLGDFENKFVAVSTDQVGDVVKLIDGVGLFGYSSTRLVKLGDSLNGELEAGWLKHIKADVSRTEVKLTQTRISTVLKNVWGMEEELEAQGIQGLVDAEAKSIEDELDKVVKGLTGKK